MTVFLDLSRTVFCNSLRLDLHKAGVFLL
uniref:Uncharacterized protein n=1 Tax=Arundo donax TaxID=35708 RepID=A0A0A9BRN9_ARUDO